MASINQVISVQTVVEDAPTPADNMNVCTIFTTDTSVLTPDKRFREYTVLKEVASDFGTLSDIYKMASIFFAQTPNAVDAGGSLKICLWLKDGLNVPAKAGYLVGAPIKDIASLTAISDGSLKITIDGVEKTYTGLDFSSASDFDGVVSVFATKVGSDAVVTSEDNKITITSPTTGASSSVDFAVVAGSGTDVSALLGLADGALAVKVAGADAIVAPAEEPIEALQTTMDQTYFRAVFFADVMIDAQRLDVSSWVQANKVMCYEAFIDVSYLEQEDSNPVYQIAQSGRHNYRMIYAPNGNRLLALGYMSIMHAVDFSQENSAINLTGKRMVGVDPVSMSDTIVDKAMSVGLEVYTFIKRDPVFLQGNVNDQVDNVYNVLSLEDYISVELFNLIRSEKKVPMTPRGRAMLENCAENVCKNFVRAGIIAPNAWQSSDTFGDEAVFKRHIAQFGYYVLVDGFDSEAMRVSRTAHINIAVKLAGGIDKIIATIRVEY